MKYSSPVFRFYFLALIVLLGASGLVVKLWYVQIARGAEYTSRTASTSKSTVRIPAVRGEILDRNGMPLVENRASVDVDFYLPDMVSAYRRVNKTVPSVSYRGTVNGMPKDLQTADIEKVVEEIIIPRLQDMNLASDYNSNKLKMHFRFNSEVPFNYRQDIDFPAMAAFSERNLDLPGVNVAVKPVRHYVYGSLAAHMLGYVGMPNDLDKLPDIKKFNFYDPDMEGKAQIELFMNDYLKGEPGVKILKRDAKGRFVRDDVRIIEPKQGANVYLTIDARIQYICEQALRSVGRGAAVVVDPNNGDILAMASVPSYDPNKFIPAINVKDWSELNKDDTNPLLNRAISSYAPGSTYKIPTALAGLRAGIGGKSYNCAGGVQYGNKFMMCWIMAQKHGSHGMLDLEGALKNSCNAYFYQYGNAAGIDQIVATGNMLGLGQKSGIPLTGESPGILPGPEYLAQISPNERWSSGYTANTSIGQGMVLASPLQMAMVTAAVANGGTCYYPRLIDKVVAQDGTVVMQKPAEVRADLIKDGGIKPEDLERVRHGMWRVVNEGGGTGGAARIKDFIVAGKTGTAQNWTMMNGKKVKDNHVWFVSFGPYDKPRYAVCVFVQGAKSGGGVAAPIAAKIYSDILAMEAGTTPVQVAALEPAKGNYNHIESIDFGREIPAATAAVAPTPSDEEAAPESDDNNASDGNAPSATPNLREDSDDRGRVRNKERKANALDKFFNFFSGKKSKDKPAQQPSGRR